MTVLFKTNIDSNKSLKIEDARSAVSFKKHKTPNYRYIMHRLAGFSPEEYNDMEYDLSESSRIIDTESVVNNIFRIKKQLILKNGFQLLSKNDRNLEYIQKRLNDFEFISSLSFKDFLAEVAENLVNFNNTFILKYRNEERSSGLIRYKESGAEIKPIAGLYTIASPTIDTATNPKTGHIVRYRHRVSERFSRQFKPDDIYHIYNNKRVGITIGTPPLETVKDDIFMWRSIEQDTENMIHKHANPFVVVEVGTDKSPARVLGDGSSELDVYSQIIDNIDEQGGVAVPHRVNVKYLGAESQALRLESYLSYFQKRVFLGLSSSETDLGLNSSGSSVGAEAASNVLAEDVRALQNVIENFFTDYIFNELLLEAPFYRDSHWIPHEERVHLNFLEHNIDKRIKLESHYLLLYQSGLISKEAAIRKMEYDLEDVGPGLPQQGSNENAVKSSISNNIIAPKNQHNLSIADSLVISHHDSLTDYYNKDYDTFIETLKEYFPEDLIVDNDRFFKCVHNNLDYALLNHGSEFVNKYVEDCVFHLASKNT